VKLNMETEQVRAQHALKDLLLPGTNAEGFRIRPGDMPEQSDPGIGPTSLQ
jgi:hypothetical protein